MLKPPSTRPLVGMDLVYDVRAIDTVAVVVHIVSFLRLDAYSELRVVGDDDPAAVLQPKDDLVMALGLILLVGLDLSGT